MAQWRVREPVMLLMFPPFYPPSRAKIANMCRSEVSLKSPWSLKFSFLALFFPSWWPSWPSWPSSWLFFSFCVDFVSIFDGFVIDFGIKNRSTKIVKFQLFFYCYFWSFLVLCWLGFSFLHFVKYQFYINFYSVLLMLAFVAVATLVFIFCCSWPWFLVCKITEKSWKNC